MTSSEKDAQLNQENKNNRIHQKHVDKNGKALDVPERFDEDEFRNGINDRESSLSSIVDCKFHHTESMLGAGDASLLVEILIIISILLANIAILLAISGH